MRCGIGRREGGLATPSPIALMEDYIGPDVGVPKYVPIFVIHVNYGGARREAAASISHLSDVATGRDVSFDTVCFPCASDESFSHTVHTNPLQTLLVLDVWR